MAIGDRIRLARQMTGVSLRDLARQTGVSAMAISKYERDLTTPRSGVLIRLADSLGVGVEFFLRPPLVERVEIAGIERQDLTADQQSALLGQIREWLERYLETELLLAEAGSLEIIPFAFPAGFPRQVASVEEGENAARALREAWEIGTEPIADLTTVLESRGIKVGSLRRSAGLDACAVWVEAAARSPVVVVRDDLPEDRARFLLACQLAHLLVGFPEECDASVCDETVARFARAFLAPAEAVRSELGRGRQTISPYELHLLKHAYGLSMQAWIERATEIGILDADAAQRLLAPFRGSNGATAPEPGDPLPVNATTRLERLVVRAVSEGLIGQQRASELLAKPFSLFCREVAEQHGGLPILDGGRHEHPHRPPERRSARDRSPS